MPSFPSPILSLRQIRAIVAVADAQGFATAAEAIGASQSTLSRAIGDAESALGVTLFRRGWNGAEATAEGELVVRTCARALGAIHDEEDWLAVTAGTRPNLPGYLSWSRLDAVAAVAAGGGASAAARLLGVSQPQISRLLAPLAKACGQEIFQRGRKGLVARPAAVRLLTLRERLRSEILPLSERIKALAGTDSGRVAVGMTPFSEQELIAQAFGALLSKHSHLRLSAVAGSYGMLVEALRRGELDLLAGVLRGVGEDGGLRETALYAERIMVVARKDHPAARGPVTVPDLAGETWIVAPHGTPIRAYFEALFLGSGTTPPVQTCEIVTFDLAERMIARSNSLGILMYSDRRARVLGGELALVQVDLPDNRREVGLTALAGRDPTRAEVAFVEWLRANPPG